MSKKFNSIKESVEHTLNNTVFLILLFITWHKVTTKYNLIVKRKEEMESILNHLKF